MKSGIGSSIFVLVFLMAKTACFCQSPSIDSLLVRDLLCRISYIQQHHEPDFPDGMIPSYRESDHRKGLLKNDDNIFFTGLVVFTLRYLYPGFDKSSQYICDSIFIRAEPLYNRHRNRKGRFTYNYWQTDKPEIFPNGGLLNLFNKGQALPDDMDVTSIILLAANAPESRVSQVHTLMQDYTNGKFKKAKATMPQYRNLPAYSTWFGNKMPVDFDFCVLTNILYMVDKYKLTYTGADSASLRFLCKVIEDRDYMNHATVISPSYNRTPVLLYHLSRLMSQTKIDQLEKFRSQLIKDAETLYEHSGNFFDKIILSTSLMRWGVEIPDETVFIHSNLETFIEENNFVFFIADMASMLPDPFNVLLGKTGIGKFYYYSPAYNYVLLLENMMVKQEIKKRRENTK